MIKLHSDLKTRGWVKLSDIAGLKDWVEKIAPHAAEIANDPNHRAEWLRNGATWFAGVNVLGNSPKGAVADGPDLPSQLFSILDALGLPTKLDDGQLSIVYPGYPRKDPSESDAAHKYRKNRDAAHVDGLLPVGSERRRHLHEPHAYVLGIPLNSVGRGASPMVIWEGSHLVVQMAFESRLRAVPSSQWCGVDLTELYHTTRRHVFETCRRVEVTAAPGEAYLVHRCALHGVAPWQNRGDAPPEGRMVVYFRPEFAETERWLEPD